MRARIVDLWSCHATSVTRACVGRYAREVPPAIPQQEKIVEQVPRQWMALYTMHLAMHAGHLPSSGSSRTWLPCREACAEWSAQCDQQLRHLYACPPCPNSRQDVPSLVREKERPKDSNVRNTSSAEQQSWSDVLGDLERQVLLNVPAAVSRQDTPRLL